MVQALILSVVLPIVVATALVSIGHQLWRPGSPVAGGRWSVALAPSLGALAAIWAVKSLPGLPPSDYSQWAVWMSLLAAVGVLVLDRTGAPPAAHLGFRGLISLLVPFLVLSPLVNGSWGLGTTLAWVLGAGGAIFLAWTVIDAQREAVKGPKIPLALTIWGTAGAIALAASGTMLLGQETGGATATLGVITVLGLLRPELDPARLLAGPISVVVLGLVLAGVHYAEVSTLTAALVAFVPLTLLAARRNPFAQSGLQGLVMQGALTFAVAAAAISVAAVQGAPEAADDAEDSNSYGY
ncbi:MAG: hypothetical protein AAFU79_17000 [Myxococcota bacterium]